MFKVNRQGHKIYFSFFDITDLRNVRIDAEINFLSRFLQEKTKIIPVQMYDLVFQR